MAKLVPIMVFLAYLLVAGSTFAATAPTYHIDCQNGSDSNTGTSDSTPWALTLTTRAA